MEVLEAIVAGELGICLRPFPCAYPNSSMLTALKGLYIPVSRRLCWARKDSSGAGAVLKEYCTS